MKRLYVITATDVRDTGKYSFKFMAAGPRDEFSDLFGTWGFVHLRKKGESEFEPFNLYQDETGPKNVVSDRRWETFVFESGGKGQKLCASAGETPDLDVEKGLQAVIQAMPECILLMKRDIFDRFEKACAALPNVNLRHYHHDGELSTS